MNRGTVLVVGDDRALGDLVSTVLREEGYAVSVLCGGGEESARAAIVQLEPDCILLDSDGIADHGRSWRDAAWALERARPVPVVMFTADARGTAAAKEAQMACDRRVAYFGVLAKPFPLEALLEVVASAAQQPRPIPNVPAPTRPADGYAGPAGSGGDAGAGDAQKAARIAGVWRRQRLEHLRADVAALQDALRAAAQEAHALQALERQRSLTEAEGERRRELARRVEAQGRRLQAIKSEVQALQGDK